MGQGMGFLETARARAAAAGVELVLDEERRPKLMLRIRAAGGGGGRFEVRLANAADRLAEALRLARRIRTGDPAFDGRFHVDADDEAFPKAYFADAAKREAVGALFAARATALTWKDGRAEAIWRGFRPKDGNADFIGPASEALQALTFDAPAAGPAPLAASGWSETRFIAAAQAVTFASFLLLSALVLLGRFLYGRPVAGVEMFLASLRFSAPAGAACVVLGAARLKGKSWFLKGLGRLALAAAAAFPTLGCAAFQLGNSVLDGAPPVRHVVPVVGKSISGRRHATYCVELSPWRPGLRNRAFEVSLATYVRVQRGTTLAELTTRPGRFGHEWVVSLEFADAPAGKP